MLTMIDRNGPPHATICPAFLCDECLEPIHDNGWVLWRTEYDDGQPVVEALHTVHGSPRQCGRVIEQRVGRLPMSQELPSVVQQLAYNLEHQFADDPATREGEAEYVAPKPSTWRVGRYER